MTDGVIKSTGNSRYLKSVANFMTLFPTYEDFAAALVAGNLPIDLNGINPDGWNQQGTLMNKANLLADTTGSALGLGSTGTVNTAFQRLAVGIGKHGFLIHLRLPDGTPLPGAPISGLTSLTGGAVVTNANGDAVGVSSASSVTVSVTSIWLDVSGKSQTLTASGPLREYTITLSQKAVGSVLRIENSQTVKFAKAHSAMVCCVQGGTGGTAGAGYVSGTTTYAGGNGGASGKIVNKTVTLEAGKGYPATVGAGGSGPYGQIGHGSAGSPGGETSFAGVTSVDGTTSTLPLNDSTLNIGGRGGNGGAGNGNNTGGGYNGSAGTKAGGGGAGGNGYQSVGKGGSSPGGEAGSDGNKNSAQGASGGNGGPGGGGGGGGGCNGGTTAARGGKGGDGGPGIVLVKLLS